MKTIFVIGNFGVEPKESSVGKKLADSIYVIGHPEGVTDYSTILKHFDLKEMGIAWTEYGEQHRALVGEIKELLLRS